MAPDIVSRFAKLEKSLRKLRNIGATATKEAFLADDDLQDIVVYNFQVVIEALIDLGNSIVSNRAYRKPESNADVFQVLAEEEVIEKALAVTMRDWTGLRNLLVHQYADTDYDTVYDILSKELAFPEQVAKVLASELGL